MSAEAFARRGHRIVIVTPNYGAASREERDGVEVNRFPFPVRLSPGLQEGRWLLHRNPVVGLYFAWWIWRTARRTNPTRTRTTQPRGLVEPRLSVARPAVGTRRRDV